MMTDRRFDQELSAGLADLAQAPYPEYIDEILAVTAHTRRRPAWMFINRWLPFESLTRLRPLVVMLLVVTALVLALAALLYVGSRPRLPDPFGVAASGLIVYQKDGDLYVQDTLNGAARKLVGSPLMEMRPVFSRQGDQIIYVRSVDPSAADPWVVAEVWIARLDGSPPRRLAGPYTVNRVEWSPYGSMVVIAIQDPEAASLETSEGRIVVVATDGGEPRILDLGMDVDSPTWRPGGDDQLVFRGRGPAGWGLYIVNADGSDARRLALPGAGQLFNNYEPAVAWAPDGLRFAHPALEPGDSLGTNGYRIHVAEIDVSGMVRSDAVVEFDGDADDEFQPRWLPTDDQILFVRGDANSSRLVIGGIAGGPDIAEMATVAYGDVITYELAPDGRSVIALFRNARTSWVWDLDTGDVRKVELSVDDVASYQRLAP
jgi:Tol biopolymer transport system component